MTTLIDENHTWNSVEVLLSLSEYGEDVLLIMAKDAHEILLPYVCKLRENYRLYAEYEQRKFSLFGGSGEGQDAANTYTYTQTMSCEGKGLR